MKSTTDLQARRLFSESVNRLLAARRKNVHWLMLETNENANRIYPACRGETNVSAGLMVRVATALGVTLDDLVPTSLSQIDRKPRKEPKRSLSRILEKNS